MGKKVLFDPKSGGDYRISRSTIDLFINCPRCFYMDKRLGLGRPPGLPFALNTAVDGLLKKEFDAARKAGKTHYIMAQNKIDAVPANHPNLEDWRNNFQGVQARHEKTHFFVTGAIDDIWLDKAGELHVVDYKSTSNKDEIVAMDKPHHVNYKRQAEVYQWLLRKNGEKVSDIAYFFFCNADKTKEEFGGKLCFRQTIVPYTGSDAWVEGTLEKMRACLIADEIPDASADCDQCTYCLARAQLAAKGKKA